MVTWLYVYFLEISVVVIEINIYVLNLIFKSEWVIVCLTPTQQFVSFIKAQFDIKIKPVKPILENKN